MAKAVAIAVTEISAELDAIPLPCIISDRTYTGGQDWFLFFLCDKYCTNCLALADFGCNAQYCFENGCATLLNA